MIKMLIARVGVVKQITFFVMPDHLKQLSNASELWEEWTVARFIDLSRDRFLHCRPHKFDQNIFGDQMGKFKITNLAASFLLILSSNLSAQTVDDGVDAAMKQDFPKAIEIFKKLAERNDRIAIYNLGILYWSGIGFKKDEKTAFNFLIQSAKLGYSKAQYEVGRMYLTGIGIQQDYADAVLWLVISKKNGGTDAQRLISQIDIEVISEMAEVAERCISSNYKNCVVAFAIVPDKSVK